MNFWDWKANFAFALSTIIQAMKHKVRRPILRCQIWSLLEKNVGDQNLFQWRKEDAMNSLTGPNWMKNEGGCKFPECKRPNTNPMRAKREAFLCFTKEKNFHKASLIVALRRRSRIIHRLSRCLLLQRRTPLWTSNKMLALQKNHTKSPSQIPTQMSILYKIVLPHYYKPLTLTRYQRQIFTLQAYACHQTKATAMIPSRILSNSMQNKENKLTMLHYQTKAKKESLQNLQNQYAKKIWRYTKPT